MRHPQHSSERAEVLFRNPVSRYRHRGGVTLTVTFYGVRGSTPCPCEANLRYGGNTACVALEAPGCEPIVLDLGTGLRYWGDTLPKDGSFRGSALITHLHWDHVQGLPFFVPIDRPGARLDIYGPPQNDCTLEQAFEDFMRPPYFPVRFTDLRGDIRFHDVTDTDVAIGDAKVKVRASRTSGSPTVIASRWVAPSSRTSATTSSRWMVAWTSRDTFESCAKAPTS